MDKKILQLAEENDISSLIKTLNAVEEEEVTKMIANKALRGKGDPVAFVRAILIGSPPDDTTCISRRLKVYKFCINMLQKNEMNNKQASDLVGLLMLEAGSLPGPSIGELTFMYVDAVKNGSTQCGKALELFPILLSVMAVQENISYGGSHLSGAEYKSHTLNTLCSCKWDAKHVIHLAAMFRDVPLTSDELKFVIEKVLRQFKELDLQDLPAFVYQILLLSSKGHKRKVLEGIISHFVEMDKIHKPSQQQECSEDLLDDEQSNVETLRHTEGTVILHISFAVMQDQELGKEYVKILKGNQQNSAGKIMVPFNFALALSLSRIHRFEDQLFDILKSTVQRSLKDAERQSQSFWVRELVPESCDIRSCVLETVQNSKYGWDHVVQGLVQLGFLLMDTFGPKSAFGKVDVTTPQGGPNHESCKLGAEILLNTFKAHEMVRSEILEQIINRVITKATSPVSHFLRLLGDTVYAAPQLILESTTKMHGMFDYLSYLSPMSAEGLLTAIQPLLKLSVSLRDSLILVLRKSMFSRQLDARKIGVSGFLMMLKHFRVIGGLPSSQASQAAISSSQVQVDIHARYNPSSNEALCLEILGNLRRCLTQQADVRLLLYQGLFDVLCRNTQLQTAILEILLAQLKKYYESGENINPPLKLEPCIQAQGDQVYLCEPLAHLLCCVHLCLDKVKDIQVKQRENGVDDDDNEPSSAQTELEDMMESLIERMIESEMEDFELDKSADFSVANSVGVKNNIFAILVLSAYEVLMEFTFTVRQYNESGCQQVLRLFENYHKLSGVLKEKVAAAAGKRGGKASTKAPHSLLSISFVTAILQALISDKVPSHQSSLEPLRHNVDFIKYLLSVAQQKITQVQEKGECDGAEGQNKTKLFKYLSTIGSLLLTYYSRNQKKEDAKGSRTKQILTQCLEGLVSIVNIITSRYPENICQFLKEQNDEEAEEDIEKPKEDLISHHITKFQKLVINILTADEDDQNLKEASCLLNMISILVCQLPANSPSYEQVHHWVHKLCTEQTIDDLSICKLLLSTLLSMTQKIRSTPSLLRDLCQDIHSQLGDIDKEIVLEDKTHFALVTNRSAAPTVLLPVLHHIDQELDNTEWVISHVKADTLAASDSNSRSGDEHVNLTQREDYEKSICTRLGILITAFHELVQSTIPIGNCTDILLKLATRLYGTVTSLVKYYLTMYAQRCGHLSARFEKLVKLSGTHLTQYCYALINYIQASESEQLQQAADKPKKKKDNKKKDKKGSATFNAAKSNVMKQTRTIPNLIFAIEQYERYLIQLSKKSKVDLMEHMKLSTSRDFRINVAVLENMDGDSSEDSQGSEEDEVNEIPEVRADSHNETGSENSDDEDRENQMPPNKKARMDEQEKTAEDAPKMKENLLSRSRLSTKAGKTQEK
ncbi:hypothetical protein CHS0354_014625 [Potamilus streckersoni]|uniref:Fanconi anemia group I protein n=1 Tax=Potamilus streckersoni TaxID=2493646 RepID=A0AAE0SPS3_9BIVA|nr:hypothetical protein CHS0354_014625 [Potamilus streckersoni]